MEKKIKRVVFVFHDSSITGATIVLLRYIDWLKKSNSIEPLFLMNYDGVVVPELKKLGTVLLWNVKRNDAPKSIAQRIAGKLRKKEDHLANVMEQLRTFQPDLIYGNTLVVLPILKKIKDVLHVKTLCHAHELSLAVKTYRIKMDAAPCVDEWLANSQATKKMMVEEMEIAADKINVCYPPIPSETFSNQYSPPKKWPNKFVVGSSGMAIARKGSDSFIELAVLVNKLQPENDFLFVWVGNMYEREQEILHEIEKCGLKDKLIFTGGVKEPATLFSQFDIFASLSKEESFGLACAESAFMGKPVCGFEKTGGIEELVTGCGGFLVPYLDLMTFAQKLIALRKSPEELKRMGENSSKFAKEYSSENVCSTWEKLLLGMMGK